MYVFVRAVFEAILCKTTEELYLSYHTGLADVNTISLDLKRDNKIIKFKPGTLYSMQQVYNSSILRRSTVGCSVTQMLDFLRGRHFLLQKAKMFC